MLTFFSCILSTHGGHTYSVTSFNTIPDDTEKSKVLRRSLRLKKKKVSQDSRKTVSVCSVPNEDDALILAAMEVGSGIKEERKIKKNKSGLETCISSVVAEGDDEPATAYSKLLVDRGKKRPSKDIVEKATKKKQK